MHLNHVALPILHQVLITTALYIDITHPASLFQENNTNNNNDTASVRLPPPDPTNRYYVECERVSDQASRPFPGLNPSNCLQAVPSICHGLTVFGHVERWIWAEWTGCALGYFLPRTYRRQGQLPTEEECSNDIYGAIIQRCAFDSRFNAGSINVERLPIGPEDSGRPMTEGFPRYAMAPKRL